ncbi:hypothetical protein LXL04_035844 [Taraxacum kok-saghyz]
MRIVRGIQGYPWQPSESATALMLPPCELPLFPFSSFYLHLFHCLKMSTANYALAEAYVMKKHLEKKMKTTTSNAHGTTKQGMPHHDHHASSSIGCFSTLFKKIHPSTIPDCKNDTQLKFLLNLS